MNTSTVYRLEKQMRETGSVKTRTSQRGRKHALTPEDLQNIDRVVQQEPDITIDEIIDKLGLHVCNETVRKAVISIPNCNRTGVIILQEKISSCLRAGASPMSGKNAETGKNICRRKT